MISVMIKYFEGTLDLFTRGLSDGTEWLDSTMLKAGAGLTVREAVEKATDMRNRTTVCRFGVQDATHRMAYPHS